MTSNGGQLDMREVSKVFSGREGEVVALDHCSLSIGHGEFVALVGPSGCGKTTLLNIVAGFEPLTSGSVLLDEHVLAEPGRLTPPNADRVVVFQQGALFPWKTVLDNVAYGPIVQGRMSAAEARLAASQLLLEAGLGGREQAFPGRLSSGLRRVVEVLRALINRPRVLLMDEPFRALDSATKTSMHRNLLALLAAHATTVVFVTHDLDEAIRLADRVIVMSARPGRITVDLPIPLPRGLAPRERAAPELLAPRERLLGAVRESARASFLSGDREMA